MGSGSLTYVSWILSLYRTGQQLDDFAHADGNLPTSFGVQLDDTNIWPGASTDRKFYTAGVSQ